MPGGENGRNVWQNREEQLVQGQQYGSTPHDLQDGCPPAS